MHRWGLGCSELPAEVIVLSQDLFQAGLQRVVALLQPVQRSKDLVKSFFNRASMWLAIAPCILAA